MSKKVNTKKAATTATELNNATNIQELFEKYPNVSLRRLAVAADVTYTLLLKASKTPIEGIPYSAGAINYAAVAKFFDRRKIAVADLDWEALNNVSVNRKDARVIKDMGAWNVGDKVYLRKNPTIPYDIVYKTDTHIVIMLEGSTEPQAWVYNTFLLNGPQKEPRAEQAVVEAPAKKSKKSKEVAAEEA